MSNTQCRQAGSPRPSGLGAWQDLPRSFFCVCAAALVMAMAGVRPSVAQVDVALHGNHAGGSDLYGVGGSLYFPLRGYSFDATMGFEYYFAESDTDDAWAINADFHTNLPGVRFARPFTGIGLVYYDGEAKGRVGVDLKAGLYVRLLDRFIPYAQYTYRTIPNIDRSFFQVGLRVMLRRQ